jgi:hypothetical protein
MDPEKLMVVLGVAVLFTCCGALVTYRRCDGLDQLERFALRFTAGAALCSVGVILFFEVIRLPVHPATLVVIGIVGLLLLIAERRGCSSERIVTPGSTTMTVSLLAAGTFAATLAGALRHVGFAGRDPWHHALGTAWLMESGQLRQPFADWPLLHYVDGYPPGFEILLSVVCTLSGGSIEQPLKATSALIASVSVLTVYFLAKRVTESTSCGVVASLLYAVSPGALGRHVWGHSLAVVLILTALACAVELRRSARLLPAAALCFGAALLAAPSQGAKGLALGVLTTAVAWRADRRWGQRVTVAMLSACVVASVWFVPLLARTGLEPTKVFSSMDNPELRRTNLRWQGGERDSSGLAAALRGSEHRRYGIDDVLFFRPHVSVQPMFGPKRLNFIVAEGVGVPVLALTLFAFLFKPTGAQRESLVQNRTLTGVWLAFLALGAAGASIGISFYVWRFWLLIAPLTSVAAAIGVLGLSANSGRVSGGAAAGVVATALGAAQFTLALITDTMAGLWRFWLLNPGFGLVTVAAAVWGVRLLIRSRDTSARLAAVLVLLHVAIASNARLRFLTVQVEPTIFRDTVEARGYVALPEVTPKGAKVFPLSGGSRCAAIVALDRSCTPWDPRWHTIQRRLAEQPCSANAAAFFEELRDIGVEYVVLDPSYRLLLDAECKDPTLFKSRIVGLLESPDTSLVVSIPSAEQPSDSRVVIVRISS